MVTGAELATAERFTPDWLARQRTFAFHGRRGQLNLLKEKRQRGGQGYWYAYRRVRGQMLKRYLGRDEQVDPERLEELAEELRAETGEAGGRALLPAREMMVPALEGRGVEVVSGPEYLAPLSFDPLLMSRLQLPRPQKTLLWREQLLDLLDRGLEYKVTLVSGAAGYGKTTLIAQWIASREARPDFPLVASVALDEGDNDPIRFWRYVIAACQRFTPAPGREALALLLSARLPPFQLKPLEMALVALLNELSQLEQPGILVLDNVHVINSPRVVESLSFFLEHLPSKLHAILLMRGDPPFSPVRLLARNELLDISPEDLVFSLEETRVFFEQELAFPLPLRLVRQLHLRLEGWPAGLRLVSKVLPRLANEQEIEAVIETFAGNHWTVRGYFLSEVFHILPEEQQTFLLRTSVLPRLNAALCDALLGSNDSERVIEALRSGDFFLAPLDGSGEWMRYQALFAETMQQEARRRLGDEHINYLAVQASLWYEEHAFLAEAIETALSASAYERAASLLACFITIKEQSRRSVFLELYSLRHWLESLPEAELERKPDFCLYYGMILLFTLVEGVRVQSGRERIYHLLQLAEQHWRDANDTTRLAQVFSFRALLARQEGRMLQALTWARQALAWLPEEDLTWRTIALSVVGVGEIVAGTLEQAREALLAAQQFNRRLGNTMYERATRGMLNWAYVEEGALRHAAEQFRQMRAEAREQEDHDDIARMQLSLARILYEWNQLAEAEQAAREGEMLGERLQVDEIACTAALRLAWIEQARGQRRQAQERLSAWLAQGPVPQVPQSYQLYREVQAELARLKLASGDLAAVERWAGSLEQRAEILPPYQRQRERLMLARLWLAREELAEARDMLEELAAMARQTGHQAFLLNIQIVQVQVYARQGARARARELLRDVLVAARDEGYVRLFLDEGEVVGELLRESLTHLRESALQAYARDLVNASGLLSGGDLSIAQVGLPEALSPQELRVLRLLVAGNSNADIARELVVSVNTVRSHVQNLYRKLDVSSRVQASVVARQLGLV